MLRASHADLMSPLDGSGKRGGVFTTVEAARGCGKGISYWQPEAWDLESCYGSTGAVLPEPSMTDKPVFAQHALKRLLIRTYQPGLQARLPRERDCVLRRIWMIKYILCDYVSPLVNGCGVDHGQSHRVVQA